MYTISSVLSHRDRSHASARLKRYCRVRCDGELAVETAKHACGRRTPICIIVALVRDNGSQKDVDQSGQERAA